MLEMNNLNNRKIRVQFQMREFLFAYGTLMSTENTEAARRLAAEADLLGPASTSGRLFDQGRWPGLKLTGGRTSIAHGELWRLHSPQSLAWLDLYEGIKPGIAFPEYARHIITIAAPSGEARQAWGYVYQWPVNDCDIIPSGRWRDRRARSLTGPSLPYPPVALGSPQLPA